jgi:hypothetical protein
MRKDGRTDMTKLIVAFRYFAIEPKNYYTNLRIKNTTSDKVIQKTTSFIYKEK